MTIYEAGQHFTDAPGAHHSVSETPAIPNRKTAGDFVVDSGDTVLTVPDQ